MVLLDEREQAFFKHLSIYMGELTDALTYSFAVIDQSFQFSFREVFQELERPFVLHSINGIKDSSLAIPFFTKCLTISDFYICGIKILILFEDSLDLPRLISC